jgi:hypothetical protein
MDPNTTCSTLENPPTTALDNDLSKNPRAENFKQIEDSLKNVANNTTNNLEFDRSGKIADEDTFITSSFELPIQQSAENQQPENPLSEIEVVKRRNSFADEANVSTEFNIELKKSRKSLPEKTYSRRKSKVSKTVWDVSSSEPSTPIRTREYEKEEQNELVTVKLKLQNTNDRNAESNEDKSNTSDGTSSHGIGNTLSTTPKLKSNLNAPVDDSEPTIKRRRKDRNIIQTQVEEVDGIFNRTRMRTNKTVCQGFQSVAVLPNISKNMSTSTPIQYKKNNNQKQSTLSRPNTSQSRNIQTSTSDLSLQQNQGSVDTTLNNGIEFDFGNEVRYTQLEESFNQAASQISQMLVQKFKNLEKDIVSKQMELEDALHARYNKMVETMKTEFKSISNTHESNLQNLQKYYHDRIKKLTSGL